MENAISVSVIIPNYNYANYVAQAIESALSQDWPKLEVIVVDDGSSDGSVDVIKAFEGRITAVFTENRGQREANNTGFAKSSGDIVIFLDSDDVLLPGMVRSVAEVWRPGLSKVQVMMQRVDANRRPIGNTIPKTPLKPTPEEIRRLVYATFEYPTPPASGNAWSRVFLEKIFPLDERFDSSTDSTCIAMAPFMGDILTIPRPLVLYRMHGLNDSTMTANEENYSREVERAVKRFEAACYACQIESKPQPDRKSLFYGGHLLQFRIAALRLTPDRKPLKGDSRLRALIDSLLLLTRPSFESQKFRILIVGWSIITVLAPLKIARVLIRKRFS